MAEEEPYGKSGPKNKEILKSFGKKIGTGKLPNVDVYGIDPNTGKRRKLGAVEIRDAEEERNKGRLVHKTSKMREGGFTKRGGMYKKGYVYSDD